MDIDWCLFDRRIADPTACAFRWVDARLAADAGASSGAAELSAMGRQARMHVLSRIKMLCVTTPAESPDAARVARLREAVERALEELGERTGGTTPLDPDKAERVNALWDRLSHIGAQIGTSDDGVVIEALTALERDIEKARQQPPRDCLHVDLSEMQAHCVDYLGDAHARLHEPERAAQCYENAARLVGDVGLGSAASRYRLKIARLRYALSTDYRAALTTLLQLRHDASFRIGPMTTVILDRMLAEAYSRVGDRYEALQWAARAERGLAELGFPPAESGAPTRVFEAWVRAAADNTNETVDFVRQLYQAVETATALAGVRSRVAGEAARRDAAAALVDALALLTEQMNARQAQVQAGDRAYLAAAGFGDLGVRDDAMAGLDAQLAAQKALLARLSEARRREAAGETGRPLREELRAAITAAETAAAQETADHLRDILADVYSRLERWDDAVAQWRRAAAGALERGELENYKYYMLKLTGPYMATRDHAALSAVCGEAIEVIEAHRYDLATLNQQTAFLQQGIRFYHMGVFAAWKLGDHALMLQRMELAKARASLRALSRPARASIEADEADVMRRIGELEATLRDGPVPADVPDAEGRRVLYDLLSLLRARSHGVAPADDFRLDALQASLADDEAIVYYYWLHATVLMIVGIDRTRVVTVRKVLPDAQTRALADLIGALHSMQTMRLDLDAIRRFQPLLLPEDVDALLDGKRRLAVSPHQLLHMFPFHLLSRRGDFLFEHLAVSHLPNLGARTLRFERRATAGALAVGATRFEGTDPPLPPLPGVADELDALRALYRQSGQALTVWLDDEARCARVREAGARGELAQFRVLHVATHGEDVLEQTANPMETRLYLCDGSLDGLTIASWQLNAELVVLSACHSGRRPYRNRLGDEALEADEMFGLTAAFFQAGARAVLGALWPADDAVTAELMALVHERLVTQAPDLALQAAMRAYLAQRAPLMAAGAGRGAREARVVHDDGRKRNPAYWAPFFVTRLGGD